MGKYYKAGVGFVDPDWKQIADLRKMLKEVVYQFEGLVRFVSEDEYMDDELEALFVALLKNARTLLEPPWNPVKKPPLGGVMVSKLWKEDVADLNGLLIDYGGHTAECDYAKFIQLHLNEHLDYAKPPPSTQPDCDCGWAEVEQIALTGRSGTE